MFAAPVAASGSHAALHFVENQKHLVLVADPSQSLKPFAAEMIVAPFALDRLDDDRGDIDATLGDELHDLLLGDFLAREDVVLALRLWQREVNKWRRNAWPVELGEQVRLPRVRVGEAHGVAAASVKGVAKREDVGAAIGP